MPIGRITKRRNMQSSTWSGWSVDSTLMRPSSLSTERLTESVAEPVIRRTDTFPALVDSSHESSVRRSDAADPEKVGPTILIVSSTPPGGGRNHGMSSLVPPSNTWRSWSAASSAAMWMPEVGISPTR
jgi:hypothetical protein